MCNFKKVLSPPQGTKQVKFRFIKENSNDYCIKRMCKLLQVSRTGYYKYTNHTPSKRTVHNEALKEYIIDIHKQCR